MQAHAAQRLATLALVLNALIWGLSWWPFREMQAQGLHPLWATAVLYALALTLLVALRPRVLANFWQHRYVLWLALAAGLTNVGFNWAVTVGDVVRVVLLFYLMPAWVVVLAWPLLGERPTLAALLRLSLALVGVVVVLKTPETPWPWPQHAADWLALMGGVCFALTNILLRRYAAAPEGVRMVAMLGGASVTACLAALSAAELGWVSPPQGLGWLGMAALTGVAFFMANLSLQFGAARLRANTTALIMLTEVVFATASAVWLGSSALSAQVVLGGALIVLAALWAAWGSESQS